jgi:hypothetical protein
MIVTCVYLSKRVVSLVNHTEMQVQELETPNMQPIGTMLNLTVGGSEFDFRLIFGLHSFPETD